MEKYLFKKAYNFFPKHIYGLDENYMQQIEIEKLKKHLKKAIDKEYIVWCEILNDVRKKNYNILDYTNFSLNQPSLHFKIILEKDEHSSKIFSFYSSLIIPYYYYSVGMYDNFQKLFVDIEINKNIAHPELIEIVKEIGLKFKKDIIDEKHLYIKIPDISFDNIEEGNFTVMDAFFNSNNRYL
jgi:hypothetical protein